MTTWVVRNTPEVSLISPKEIGVSTEVSTDSTEVISITAEEAIRGTGCPPHDSPQARQKNRKPLRLPLYFSPLFKKDQDCPPDLLSVTKC